MDRRGELLEVIRSVRNRWRLRLAIRGAVVVLAGTLLALFLSASSLQALRFSPAAIITFGAPGGGSARPSRSALLRKLTPSMMTHCSRAGRPFSICARSTTHACFWITSSPVLVGT